MVLCTMYYEMVVCTYVHEYIVGTQQMANDHSDYVHGYLLVFLLTGGEFLFRSPFYSNLFSLNSLF